MKTNRRRTCVIKKIQKTSTNTSFDNNRGRIYRLIEKTRRRVTRGNYLRNNPVNGSFQIRLCPPRSKVQARKLRYHNRVSKIFAKDKDFTNSTAWKPNDLLFVVCDVTNTGKLQLCQHFWNSKHLNQVWKCTPKYCSSMMYSRFMSEERRDRLLLKRNNLKFSSFMQDARTSRHKPLRKLYSTTSSIQLQLGES